MKKPLLGTFGKHDSDKHMVGPLQQIHMPMRRFKEHEEVDYVIVGVGSAAECFYNGSCAQDSTWLESKRDRFGTRNGTG